MEIYKNPNCKKIRGSHILEVSCAYCKSYIAKYQKVGESNIVKLLKGADNQSSGNELYHEKLRTYSGNGTLFAQTLLPDFAHSNSGFNTFTSKYKLEFKTYTEFDAAAIEERQKLLFEMIKIIWK